MMVKTKKENKRELALKLGVSRSSLYYQSKRQQTDETLKKRIKEVLQTNPSYGHKRIALALNLNKKRIRRVMRKFGITPYKQQPRCPKKPQDYKKPKTKWKNEIKNICPVKPDVIWASDFTYIKHNGEFLYLATIIDIYTREITGWNISSLHDTNLVLGALAHAIRRRKTTPNILHSDQGSEYDARRYEDFVSKSNTLISMSAKNSPWENGVQESFYSQFKVELGRVDRFETVEELIEEIYQTIHYYNNRRIHTKLKMSPVNYRLNYESRLCRQSV